MSRSLLLVLATLHGCSRDDGKGDTSLPIPGTSPAFDVEVTLEPVGSPTPLVWRVSVESSAPTSLAVVFDAPDHHVELPLDPTVASEHLRIAKGFHPDTTYTATVTATGEDGTVVTVDAGSLTTDPLPDAFPDIQRYVVDPARQEPGYTLVLLRPGLTSGEVFNDYLVALDAEAEVVWYLEPLEAMLLMHRIEDGTLLGAASDPESDGGPIHQFDWDGQKLGSWVGDSPKDYGIPCAVGGFHHEAFADAATGSWVSLSKVEMEVDDLPTSYTDPTPRPARIGAELLFQFDPTSPDCAVVQQVHLGEVLDTARIGYESLEKSNFDGLLDWGHGNAVWVDPFDGGLVTSLRNQDAVVKTVDGELAWILGTHANWRSPWKEKLLTPVGDLTWQYHQHSPQLHPTDPGRIIVMDNGGERVSPFEDLPIPPVEEYYSRVVEFRIDEAARTVEQTWVLDRLDGEDFYSPFVGDADYLPATDHVLATFGYLVRVGDQTNLERGFGGRSVRIVETSYADPTDVVLDIELVSLSDDEKAGWTAYRGQRIPDLYGLPD